MKYITPEELEKMFGYTLKTQAKKRCLRELPYTKLGNKVFYPLEEIEKILEKNTIGVL